MLSYIKKLCSPEKKSLCSGFTLVETALVVLGGGIMLAAFSDFIVNSQRQQRIDTTELRMAAIQQALGTYLVNKGAYPCPAGLKDPVNISTYGVDVTGNYSVTSVNFLNCEQAPVLPGTYRVNNAGTIRIGAVPVRTLNLPDEYMNDGWNYRFIYAVTESQAAIPNITAFPGIDLFSPTGGKIGIIDGSSTSVINPPNSADYIIISTGPQHNGAYTSDGAMSPCNTTTVDSINCPALNTNGIFRDATVTGENVTNSFNELVSYYAPTAPPILNVPPGSITTFSLQQCPSGWTAAPLTLTSEQLPPIDPIQYVYCQKQ